jgi:hypothetical protein
VETRALQKQKHTGSVMTPVSLARLVVIAALVFMALRPTQAAEIGSSADCNFQTIMGTAKDPAAFDRIVECEDDFTQEVVVAVMKRFPDAKEQPINWSALGKGRYDVDFYTAKRHMACDLKLNPIRLRKCRTVHA